MKLEQKNTQISMKKNSNGELFLLEKAGEISAAVFKQLEAFGFQSIVLDEYNVSIAEEIYKKLPKEIILENELTCKEKGKMVIEILKNRIMEDVKLLINMAVLASDIDLKREAEIIENLNLFLKKVEIRHVTSEIKNLAWNCD